MTRSGHRLLSKKFSCVGSLAPFDAAGDVSAPSEFLSLSVILEGPVRLRIDAGDTATTDVSLKSDDIVFTPARMGRPRTLDGDRNPAFRLIFPAAPVEAALACIGDDNGRGADSPSTLLTGFVGPPGKQLRQLNRLIIGEFTTPRPGGGIMTDALTEAFFLELGRSLLDRDSARSAIAGFTESERARLVGLMAEAIDGSIGLGEIAASMGLPPHGLSRKFRASFGETPRSHLMRLRLDRARQLLRTTAAPLAEVAFDCGFCSQAHMTTCFRKEFGVTPARYRSAETLTRSVQEPDGAAQG